MTRRYCNACARPEAACICEFTCSIDNDIHVVILQHPSEVKQSKGSVPLLTMSLANITCLVGEDFVNNEEFLQILATYHEKIALLYPSDKAVLVNNAEMSIGNVKCIILLDGTWKKAFKMYQMNKMLHALPHIALPDEFESLYQIRKTKKKGALSTIEACCYALSSLDANKEKYQPLLENFKSFNAFLLAFDKRR